MADDKLTRLADPENAIASYLDELLHTATDTALREETATPEPVKPATQEAPVATRTKPAPVPTVEKPAASPEPPRPAQGKSAEPVRPVERQAPEEPVSKQKVEVRPEPEPEPAAPPSRPEWSEQPFECLIFTVAGLQLAVPLILLGAIHRIEEEIRPIPGSPRWYMGIRPDRDHNLRVVDTAEWIMAGRVPSGVRDNYRFVIRLDNSDWGLACDDVAQSFTLRPDEVRWRTARSKRPWLAGTVIDHMCALIDVRTMADLLVRAEREHHLDLS
ncbi:purine-binding chemotaxis protein CheW [Marinobacter sp. es.048]|uniref:chemotaxis protein CheW n=1 Tax=Marinobacter sp. es.048 TaxID=1761795 RepID=UPI000B588128|nr:chemotaxis protein CheW [Marinobacter sp. es.048]SNC67265.1 purine-binding chemotaxis protein CheW [Marinobacter sp. es.048]